MPYIIIDGKYGYLNDGRIGVIADAPPANYLSVSPMSAIIDDWGVPTCTSSSWDGYLWVTSNTTWTVVSSDESVIQIMYGEGNVYPFYVAYDGLEHFVTATFSASGCDDIIVQIHILATGQGCP